jgi:hypothetical protein
LIANPPIVQNRQKATHFFQLLDANRSKIDFKTSKAPKSKETLSSIFAKTSQKVQKSGSAKIFETSISAKSNFFILEDANCSNFNFKTSKVQKPIEITSLVTA